MRATPYHGSSRRMASAGSSNRVVGLFSDFHKGVK